MQPRWNTLLPAIFLSMSLACAHRLQEPRSPPLHDAQEVQRRAKILEDQVVSLKGDARLRIRSPKGNGSVSLYVAVARPSFLHLEALNFFGQPEAILTSDGKTFGLYQAVEGKFYRGPASPQNVSRLLPVTLPADELVTILLGSAPLVGSDHWELGVSPDGRAYILQIEHQGAKQRLWIDAQMFRVLKSEVSGPKRFDLLFEDFTSGAIPFSRKIVLSTPVNSTILQLAYRDVVMNETLSANLFKGAPPQKIPVIDVDEDGQPVVKSSSF